VQDLVRELDAAILPMRRPKPGLMFFLPPLLPIHCGPTYIARAAYRADFNDSGLFYRAASVGFPLSPKPAPKYLVPGRPAGAWGLGKPNFEREKFKTFNRNLVLHLLAMATATRSKALT
jgi:hypothetical protein